jgi:acyl dehydratase
MDEQQRFPEIEVGTEIPAFSNRVSYMEINQFAGANREWGLHHMDPEYSRGIGLKDVIIMGNIKMAYVGNMLEDWLGEDAWIQKIATSYRGLDYVGDTLTSRGRVTNKFVHDGRTYVECEIWVENQRGEKGTTGSATIVLPESSL